MTGVGRMLCWKSISGWNVMYEILRQHNHMHQGRRNRGGGGGRGALAPQKTSNTLKMPFESKICTFLLRKRAFSSIFKSLNANFCPWRGSHYYREGTKWAKGHLHALMGHLSCHIWALIATTEPGIISPVNLSHCPWRGTVKGGGIRGPGVLALPKFPHPKSASFF